MCLINLSCTAAAIVAEKKQKLSLSTVLEKGQDDRSRAGADRQMKRLFASSSTITEAQELQQYLCAVDDADKLFREVPVINVDTMKEILKRLKEWGLEWPDGFQKRILGRTADEAMKTTFVTAAWCEGYIATASPFMPAQAFDPAAPRVSDLNLDEAGRLSMGRLLIFKVCVCGFLGKRVVNDAESQLKIFVRAALKSLDKVDVVALSAQASAVLRGWLMTLSGLMTLLDHSYGDEHTEVRGTFLYV